ncbi:hypothetical protein CEXT_85961 [Caerostris extrusa]|uniref:Uncharacterized protein n=1 Tax=Caerostris extrusa TaxID=172846 RepID=A0AAV4Y4F5_CAEEX|nr:hypothetical protein CEXT_85961 [Caerostris extrusa]
MSRLPRIAERMITERTSPFKMSMSKSSHSNSWKASKTVPFRAESFDFTDSLVTIILLLEEGSGNKSILCHVNIPALCCHSTSFHPKAQLLVLLFARKVFINSFPAARWKKSFYLAKEVREEKLTFVCCCCRRSGMCVWNARVKSPKADCRFQFLLCMNIREAGVARDSMRMVSPYSQQKERRRSEIAATIKTLSPFSPSAPMRFSSNAA